MNSSTKGNRVQHVVFLIIVFLLLGFESQSQTKKMKKTDVPILKKDMKNSDAYLKIDFGQTYFLQSSLGLHNRYLKHGNLSHPERSRKVFIDNITGGNSKAWRINDKGNQTYTITSATRRNADKCLSANGEMQTCDNRYSQDWKITKDKEGYYSFESVATSKFLGLNRDNAQLANNWVEGIEQPSKLSTKWKLIRSDQPFDFFVDILPEPVENKCLTNLRRGDREFNGSGPKMIVNVQLQTKPTAITATVKIELRETNSSDTWVIEEFTETIHHFTPIRPDDKNFGEIITPAYQYFELTLDGTGEHELLSGRDFDEGGPIRRMIVRGDTMGDDVSDDGDCTDDSELILLEFNPIWVKHFTNMNR